MTRKEREKSIKTLKRLQAEYNDKNIDYEGANDAYNMAIEALDFMNDMLIDILDYIESVKNTNNDSEFSILCKIEDMIKENV